MLVGFFLGRKEPPGIKCKIIRFSDRVYLPKKPKGLCHIIRLFIIRVEEDSPGPLNELYFVIPRMTVKPPVENISDTVFQKGYLFNESTTGLPSVIDSQTHELMFDNIRCRTIRDLNLSVHQFNGASILGMSNIGGLQPGEAFIARLKIRGQLNDWYRAHTYRYPFIKYFKRSTRMSVPVVYFSLATFKDLPEYDPGYQKREIPAIPILDRVTKSGGFDIHLNIPPEYRLEDYAPPEGMVDSKYVDWEAKDVMRTYVEVTWRLRKHIPPGEEGRLGKEIELSLNLEKPTLSRIMRKDGWFGYLGFIIGLLTLLLLYKDSIIAFIKSLLGLKVGTP
jgi:hypothetical protein